MSKAPQYDGPTYKQMLETQQCMYKQCKETGNIYRDTLVPVVLCDKHKDIRHNGGRITRG